MSGRWPTWRRDLVIGGAAALLTAFVLVPLGGAALREERHRAEVERDLAEDASRRAEQQAAEAHRYRALAERNLIEQAADALGGMGVNRAQTEVVQVGSDAVAPEVPKGAHLLIDKSAASYAVGDIVLFHQGGNNFLGRVTAVDAAAGRVTVARRGEADRTLALSELAGRGVLNTR